MLNILSQLTVVLLQLSTALAAYDEYKKPLDIIIATTSAYTSSIEETDDTPFITASGTTTRKGIIACSAKYPFGTKFLINQEIYDCQDRMHKKNEGNFDIWMETKKEALEYGVQRKMIKILP